MNRNLMQPFGRRKCKYVRYAYSSGFGAVRTEQEEEGEDGLDA